MRLNFPRCLRTCFYLAFQSRPALGLGSWVLGLGSWLGPRVHFAPLLPADMASATPLVIAAIGLGLGCTCPLMSCVARSSLFRFDCGRRGPGGRCVRRLRGRVRAPCWRTNFARPPLVLCSILALFWLIVRTLLARGICPFALLSEHASGVRAPSVRKRTFGRSAASAGSPSRSRSRGSFCTSGSTAPRRAPRCSDPTCSQDDSFAWTGKLRPRRHEVAARDGHGAASLALFVLGLALAVGSSGAARPLGTAAARLVTAPLHDVRFRRSAGRLDNVAQPPPRRPLRAGCVLASDGPPTGSTRRQRPNRRLGRWRASTKDWRVRPLVVDAICVRAPVCLAWAAVRAGARLRARVGASGLDGEAGGHCAGGLRLGASARWST